MGLDYIEYLVELEHAFGITIPDEKASSFQTVGDAENYLRTQRTDLDDTTIRQKHLKVIDKIAPIDHTKRNPVQSTTRFLEDLNFE